MVAAKVRRIPAEFWKKHVSLVQKRCTFHTVISVIGMYIKLLTCHVLVAFFSFLEAHKCIFRIGGIVDLMTGGVLRVETTELAVTGRGV